MASGAMSAVTRQLGRLFTTGGVAGLTEGQLLERFVTSGDGAAFEALVARHGPMVLRVCQQLLRDPNDVDDAFQATFLVLVRKAGALRRRDLLGNWLYGVAYRVAVRSRALTARRQSTEVSSMKVEDLPGRSAEGARLPELHEEVQRLPEAYRAPVVLCYLEGLTHEEAAERLGWPLGTVKGRLSRARERLRSRLVRRGVTLASGVAPVDWLSGGSSAQISTALVEKTLKAAAIAAAGKPLAVGVISAQVVALTEGVVRTMSIFQLKNAIACAAVAGTFLTGAGVFAFQGFGPPVETKASQPQAKAAVSTGKEAPPSQTKGESPEAGAAGGIAPAGGGGRGMMAGPQEGAAGGMGAMIVGQTFPGGGGGMGGGGSDTRERDNKLRLEIATLFPRLVAAGDKSPRTQAILKKLDETIAMNFAQETPLEDVIKYIKSATQNPNDSGIPIYIDPVGLRDAEKTTSSPVALDFEHVPLKTALRLLLKQVDLAYCVIDGLLIISTPEGIYQELKEAENAAGGDSEYRQRLQ